MIYLFIYCCIADIISTVEFNDDGELLATGDKGGRIVIFQRESSNKTSAAYRSDYNVYSTFQSHEAEFDYLKSLEIEEKINKIRWLRRKNMAHFLLSTNDKTVKLWKIREKSKRAESGNLRDDNGFKKSARFKLLDKQFLFKPLIFELVPNEPEDDFEIEPFDLDDTLLFTCCCGSIFEVNFSVIYSFK